MFGIEYRPKNFKEIIGLDRVKDILTESLRQNRYAPAYLFHGSLSSGKTTVARVFSRAILCENRKEDMSPCNECDSCKAFLEGKHPGYEEIDSANDASKSDIKDIKKSLSYESIGSRKIIVFDECHNISTAGNDALLKVLEEGRDNVTIIFCTTDPDKMVPALKSRCWSFRMPLPTEEQVEDKLKLICSDRGIEYEIDALKMIVRKANRHFRTAENLLDMTSSIGPVTLSNISTSISFYDDLIVSMLITVSKDLGEAIRTLKMLMSDMDAEDIYTSIIKVLNDAIAFNSGVNTGISSYDELLQRLVAVYGSNTYKVLDYIIEKEKLKDGNLLQSDLMLIHYKYLKGHFEVSTEGERESTDTLKKNESTRSSSVKKKVGLPTPVTNSSSNILSLDEIVKLSSWERINYMRQLNKNNYNNNNPDKVDIDIKSSWGGETAYNGIPKTPLKKKLSKDSFQKSMEGMLKGESI